MRQFFIIAFTVLLSTLASAQELSGYHPFYASVEKAGKSYIAIRQFGQKGKMKLLAVDPETMNTVLLSFPFSRFEAKTWELLRIEFAQTPYMKAIAAAEKQSFSLQDSGIIHGFPKEQGIALTIDLCPSHKPFDREIVTALLAEFSQSEKPVPLALSITGRFLLTHSEDIAWLENLQRKGEIEITWINHTYNHHFNPKIPLAKNFLLEPGTDIGFEVLAVESALIQRGQMPSVFFRFPGLVSDHAIVDKIISYGLIPIGSDAWLAKGQNAQSGSIVLIHGNGNEPAGIKDFVALLRSEKQKAMQKQWLLYDLRQSIDQEYGE